MKTITLFLSTIALLSAGNIAAQADLAASAPSANESTSTPEMFAKMRAAAYADALGLDEKLAEKMAGVFMEGEKQVVDQRQECRKIQEQVEATMSPYDAEVEKMLNADQLAKLEHLKKEGAWHPAVSSCAPMAAGKAGCAGHGAEGKAAGCCAGAKGAGAAK
ncbi:MAG: hypothetical protein ABI432_13775 [Flavobacteriales bacterium]